MLIFPDTDEMLFLLFFFFFTAPEFYHSNVWINFLLYLQNLQIMSIFKLLEQRSLVSICRFCSYTAFSFPDL